MCFRCLNDYFWMYTTVMLLLGWWGMFSFIKTLFALPENIFSYLSALGEFIRPGGPKVYVDV